MHSIICMYNNIQVHMGKFNSHIVYVVICTVLAPNPHYILTWHTSIVYVYEHLNLYGFFSRYVCIYSNHYHRNSTIIQQFIMYNVLATV